MFVPPAFLMDRVEDLGASKYFKYHEFVHPYDFSHSQKYTEFEAGDPIFPNTGALNVGDFRRQCIEQYLENVSERVSPKYEPHDDAYGTILGFNFLRNDCEDHLVLERMVRVPETHALRHPKLDNGRLFLDVLTQFPKYF